VATWSLRLFFVIDSSLLVAGEPAEPQVQA
jgi:hypothetical protein